MNELSASVNILAQIKVRYPDISNSEISRKYLDCLQEEGNWIDIVLERKDMGIRKCNTFPASGEVIVQIALVYSVFVHAISSSSTQQWIPHC